MLTAVANWGFSTEAARPVNCDELSIPTPRLVGKMYSDSHTLIRPRHLSMMATKLMMLTKTAATDIFLYLLVLCPVSDPTRKDVLATYLLINFPAPRAPIALPKDVGKIWSAATELDAFSVRVKYVAIFETIWERIND